MSVPARRLSVLVLVVIFSAGHSGLCAAAALAATALGDGPESAASCPLHETASSGTRLAEQGRSAGMSCCAPAERREAGSSVPLVSASTTIEPAEYRTGIVLPVVASIRQSRARDSAPPKTVATHLLLSVLLV